MSVLYILANCNSLTSFSFKKKKIKKTEWVVKTTEVYFLTLLDAGIQDQSTSRMVSSEFLLAAGGHSLATFPCD